MTDQTPIVFVVDDDAAVADAIRLLLHSVGLPAQTFPSAVEFLDAYDPDAVGCLILDVRMPGLSGLDLQARLKERGSCLPIIFLTAHGDVSMAVEAMKAGAVDFLQKPFRDQDLLDKVHESLEEANRIRSEQDEQAEIRDRMEALSPREREVLEQVIVGKSNKKIGQMLGISQRTVEVHRARVMEKMKVTSVPSLVHLVMKAPAER